MFVWPAATDVPAASLTHATAKPVTQVPGSTPP
jgi:hypothetical protein